MIRLFTIAVALVGLSLLAFLPAESQESKGSNRFLAAKPHAETLAIICLLEKPVETTGLHEPVKLKMALDGDTAKKVSAAIKDAKLKKVQAAIQGDQVRVSSPSKDDLQEAMLLLRGKDFGVELKFGNYR